VLRRGLDPDPLRRWPSMDALVARLPAKSRRGLAIGALVTALVIALVISIAAGRARQPEAARAMPVGDAVAAPVATIGADPRIASLRRFSDGHVVASQAAIGGLIAELRAGRTARLVPSTDRGVAAGFKLYAIKPGSFLDAIGFANGDLLVGLAGKPTTTVDELARALEPLHHGMRELPFELRRGSTPATIIVQVRD
nr:hypothetical protein [Myxococcota bacterium]